MKVAILLFVILGCGQDARPPELRVGQRPPTPAPPPPRGPVGDSSQGSYVHPLFRFGRPDRADEPIRDPVIAAVRLAGEEPKYTEAARRGRIEGVVILEVVIETDGSVSGGTVLKPLPFGLTDSAIAAAKTWKYKPGQVRGVAVRTVRNEIVVFKLP